MSVTQADPLEQLFGLIESWANRTGKSHGDWHDPIQTLVDGLEVGDTTIVAAVSCQEELAGEIDESFARPFLDGGMLSQFSHSRARAILTLARQMQQRRRAVEFARTLDRYNGNDPMVAFNPELPRAFSKKKEMISIEGLVQVDRSGILLGGSGERVKLDPSLNPELVNFVRKHGNPQGRVEARVDPDYPVASSDPPLASHTPELPAEILRRFAGVPFGRLLTTQRWVVDKPARLRDDPRQASEYFSGGLRSFEIHGSRADRAEVYIEQLTYTGSLKLAADPSEIDFSNDGNVVGRVIHCDTHAADDSPCEDVNLIHLDLAIYFYRGDSGAERLRKTFASGVPAERIHILKCAPIPLALLPGIAYLFFADCPRQLQQLFEFIRPERM